MAADIEFDFGDPRGPDGPDEEQLDTDRAGGWLGRVPQSVWVAAAVLVVGAALVVDLRRGTPAAPRAAATVSSSPTLSLPHVVLPVPSLQEELEAAGLDNDPLTNVIRSTPSAYACPPPRQNKLPMAAEIDAMQRAYPGFTRFESGTTLDASAGLCSVNLRAHADDGSVLIVRIAAPPNQAMTTVLAQDDHVIGAYPTFTGVDYVSGAGFRIQVGILGTGRQSFPVGDAQQLAADDALTW